MLCSALAASVHDKIKSCFYTISLVNDSLTVVVTRSLFLFFLINLFFALFDTVQKCQIILAFKVMKYYLNDLLQLTCIFKINLRKVSRKERICAHVISIRNIFFLFE